MSTIFSVEDNIEGLGLQVIMSNTQVPVTEFVILVQHSSTLATCRTNIFPMPKQIVDAYQLQLFFVELGC